ncbi:4-hydroxyphenylpyruvate dioxygenase [Stenomitos frigidus]|uniref:4-hydroxyphenylpyruvate dioxygenase n=1 Tax=Stenomitos frigidus ULC18 TaxID=2107698 RepID=A0A2T1DX86_9CYAN|nr:4-hydroxyphenylpyruvate dioxygenase [Stenomitos frigidus]PSB25105.1 4-hydroxyphenylpyruvate dioxygenase [Stenomitos frigidus ULC18]
MNDNCPIKGLDHLEFYVGNAKQAALVYSKCFGFTTTAYRGLETGDRKVTSYLLQQGEIRFVLSSALNSEYAIAQSVLKHSDTIAVIALEVSDAAVAYKQAVDRGAIGAIPPTNHEDEYGVLRYAAIRTFGDVLVKFIDRSHYVNNFAPGFVSRSSASTNEAGLKRVDHIVGNVEYGAMDQWVDFFVKTMGFDVRMHFDDHAISTEYSALMSKVLENGSKTIININEPAPGRRKSQIQEYLDFHNGPGIQHIGLATDDIVQTVVYLKQAGVEFLPIPQTYYDNLEDWVKELDIPVKQLAELGILVDRDDDGYLLQLFTKPVGDRPTLFFEIIERHGSRGFGAGNFKSLFVALEREQAARGNL